MIGPVIADDGVLERVFQDFAPIAVRAGDPRSSKGPHRAKNVRLVAEFLAESGVVEQIEAWRLDDDPAYGKRGGRRPALGDRQVLSIMLLHALAGEPYLVKELNTTMLERLDPVGRALLGLPEPDPDENPDNAYHRLYRASRNMLKHLDSAPFTSGRRLTAEQVEEVMRKRAALGPDVLAERARRMNWVCAQLLHATWLSVPKKYRDRWEGTLCVDATVVPTWGKRGSPRNSRSGKCSPELDAWWYVREEDHADKGGKKKRKATYIFGYEAHIVVASGEGEFPRLALAATLDKPGRRISGNAMACVSEVVARGLPTGWFVADRAYLPNSKEENLQGPLRALGYKLAFDYKSDQLGVQGQHAGARQVDGSHYCPSMPQPLIDATADYRDGRISEKVLLARLEARRDYQLQPKSSPDHNGVTQMRCPAAGPSPTVDCPLKPREDVPVGLGVPKPRPEITDPPEHPDRICTNKESVAFGPETGLKYRQDVPYGTPEWEKAYHGPRNTIEGFNGMFKDTNYADAASAGLRRARGFTLHWLTTALNLVATNLRRLKDFLNQQADKARRPSPSGPDKRRRTRTGESYRPDPNAPPLVGPAASVA